MKKVFILTLALGTITSVFATSNNNSSSKSNAVKAVTISNAPLHSDKGRAEQIERINREYAYRIDAIKRNRHLRGYEKNRQMRMLEMQRADEIRLVNDRYNNRNYNYNDRNYNYNNRDDNYRNDNNRDGRRW